MRPACIQVGMSIGYVVLTVKVEATKTKRAEKINLGYRPEQIDALIEDLLRARAGVLEDMKKAYGGRE